MVTNSILFVIFVGIAKISDEHDSRREKIKKTEIISAPTQGNNHALRVSWTDNDKKKFENLLAECCTAAMALRNYNYNYRLLSTLWICISLPSTMMMMMALQKKMQRKKPEPEMEWEEIKKSTAQMIPKFIAHSSYLYSIYGNLCFTKKSTMDAMLCTSYCLVYLWSRKWMYNLYWKRYK